MSLSTASTMRIRMRQVTPTELLSEEEVLQKNPDDPFLHLNAQPEPYRSYAIAYARLKPVFDREEIMPPLLVDTQKGRGLVWRLWSDQLGVVLIESLSSEGALLSDVVTFLKGKDFVYTLVLDQIVLNPPKW